MKLDNLFYRIGYTIAKFPIFTIIISLMVVGIILTGLVFLDFEVIFFKN